MLATLLILICAAALELAGDAAIRRGLLESQLPWLGIGAVGLVAYGFAVNLNRDLAFGRLMGLYIAVFFVLGQVLSIIFFGERPSLTLLAGGSLIVAGGLVIQFGRP